MEEVSKVALPEAQRYRQTLCWYCRNTCAADCSWFRNFTPVPGWKAEPTQLLSGVNRDGSSRYVDSYHIINCPEFDPERGYEHFTELYKKIETPADAPAERKGARKMPKGTKAETKAKMEERKKLYQEGFTDTYIAKAQSVSISAIKQWRLKNGYRWIATKNEETEDDLTPEQEAAMQRARDAGLIASDVPWDGENTVASDYYTYCGDMSPEDYARMKAGIDVARARLAWIRARRKEIDFERNIFTEAEPGLNELRNYDAKLEKEEQDLIASLEDAGIHDTAPGVDNTEARYIAEKQNQAEVPPPGPWLDKLGRDALKAAGERLTVEELIKALQYAPYDAVVSCAECGEAFTGLEICIRYDGDRIAFANVMLGR